MEKRPHRNLGSLTIKELLLRITVAACIICSFFSLIYYINQWYLLSRLVSGEKILVSLDNAPSNPDADKKPPSDQSASAPDLTFFKSLTEKTSPYPTKDPAPSGPKKASKPADPRSVTTSGAPLPGQLPSATPSPSQTALKPKPTAYAVQAGAFQDRSSAESLRKSLQKKGFSAYIVEARLGNGAKWYRVRVGKLLPRAEAERLAQRLRMQANLKPYVVTEK